MDKPRIDNTVLNDIKNSLILAEKDTIHLLKEIYITLVYHNNKEASIAYEKLRTINSAILDDNKVKLSYMLE